MRQFVELMGGCHTHKHICVSKGGYGTNKRLLEVAPSFLSLAHSGLQIENAAASWQQVFWVQRASRSIRGDERTSECESRA